MGFETLHDIDGQFFKENRVAVPGRVVQWLPNDKRLPEPQLKDNELPQFHQEIYMVDGAYQDVGTFQWNIVTGGLFLFGYYLNVEVDVEEFFAELKIAGGLVRQVDPVTKAITEFYYSNFPSPGWVNNIGNLVPGRGYVVSSDAAFTITKTGLTTAPVSHDLTVSQQMLAYTGGTAIDAYTVFEEVINAGALTSVEWVDPITFVSKFLYHDGSQWVNDIGNVVRGQGYIVRVTSTYNGFSF